MEVTFHEPSIVWRPRQVGGIPPTVDDLTVLEWFITATVPVHSQDTNETRPFQIQRLPSTFTIPYEDEQELLRDQPVEFRLFAGNRRLPPHIVPLRNCIPLLTETKLKWVQEATSEMEACIEVNVTTNRQPRQLIARALTYQARGLAIVQQLTVHRHAVAVGLLPPILGCIAGITLSSPIWIPLTLVIGLIGLPIWVVLAVGVMFITLISAISAVISVRLIQSKHITTKFREICHSPSAQLLLFNNASTMGDSSLPTPSEVCARVVQYVMADPSRKLVASLAIDAIGNATFAVPLLGEVADLFWSPVSASLVADLFGETVPTAKYFAFIEEFLPFTDFIPTATLAWMKENWNSEELKTVLSKLQLRKRNA